MAARSGRYGRKEYPVVAGFVHTWSVGDALREFISNCLDCETQSGPAHKAEIRYDAARQTVWMRNRGITVPRDALLLGSTSKRDASDTIGVFGSGMKEAFSVCARDGHPVTIKNGVDETWRPSFSHSKEWSAEVLCLDIIPASRKEPMFEVEVGNITPAEWEEVESRFLSLQSQRKTIQREAIPAVGVEILRGKDQAGAVYCRGVKVQKSDGLKYGYNFSHLTINRDRSLAEDLPEVVAYAWRDMAASSESYRKELYDMLDDGSHVEADSVRTYSSWSCSGPMLAEFVSRHGDKAVMVASPDEAQKVSHFGARAVAVSASLARVLSQNVGTLTFSKYVQEKNTTASKTYGVNDLTPAERAEWTRAVALFVAAVPEVKMERTSIVDFYDDGLLGLHKGEAILVAKKVVAKGFDQVLTTLIHEYAHDFGLDGSAAHVAKMSEYTEACFRLMAAGVAVTATLEAPKGPTPFEVALEWTLETTLAKLTRGGRTVSPEVRAQAREAIATRMRKMEE